MVSCYPICYALSLCNVATARFGEAIVDFLADEQRAVGKGIRVEDFEGEAYSIYELFSTMWLQSKEAKVYWSKSVMNCAIMIVTAETSCC